jgi:hypothetical protein
MIRDLGISVVTFNKLNVSKPKDDSQHPEDLILLMLRETNHAHCLL